VIDGKRVIELTVPDGTKRTINIGAAAASDAVGKIMSWTFKADKNGELAEVKEVQEQIAKVLKELDVNVAVDAGKIAERVKAAIIQAKPAAEMAKELSGEVLVEIDGSAFIFESRYSDGAEVKEEK
jgi:hypothetical protein